MFWKKGLAEMLFGEFYELKHLKASFCFHFYLPTYFVLSYAFFTKWCLQKQQKMKTCYGMGFDVACLLDRTRLAYAEEALHGARN